MNTMGFFGYKIKSEKSRFSRSSTDPFSISRSKIERYLECPRCFWLETVHGIGRPDTPPFTLNNAVDELFKNEFDILRVRGEAHPLMRQYGINAVPFQHEKIDEWRDALRKGVSYIDKETNLLVRGGIDDVWINSEGELHVVDYKATAGKKEVTLDDEWKNVYKRQVEIYQWLFKKNGFTVSPIAYFVYANGKNDKDAFDGLLEFEITILPYVGNSDWVDKTIKDIRRCLESESAPKSAPDCEYCAYREHAGKTLLTLHREGKIDL